MIKEAYIQTIWKFNVNTPSLKLSTIYLNEHRAFYPGRNGGRGVHRILGGEFSGSGMGGDGTSDFS